jgi:spore coat protein JC
MFKYDKKLPYPVDIKSKDLKMAKYIVTQFGGANGELAAALRYFSQKFSMPTEEGKALLNDIAVEEMGHNEMIATMLSQLMKGATVRELEDAGLSTHYAEHGMGLYPNDSNGVPFTASYIANVGDPIANLVEDMAAEQKARAVYEHLIDLADDEDFLDFVPISD